MSTTNTSSNKASVTTWRPTRRDTTPKSFQFENSQDSNGISVCIRFAFKNITPQRVFACLKKANINVDGRNEAVFLGMIERIDEVIRKDGNKMFFVHFSPNSWGKTPGASDALTSLCDGELQVNTLVFYKPKCMAMVSGALIRICMTKLQLNISCHTVAT